jgi:hypothetical protein
MDVFVAKLHMMAACLTAVFGTDNQTIGVNEGIVLDEWGDLFGLPAGGSENFWGSRITISGMPLVAGNDGGVGMGWRWGQSQPRIVWQAVCPWVACWRLRGRFMPT